MRPERTRFARLAALLTASLFFWPRGGFPAPMSDEARKKKEEKWKREYLEEKADLARVALSTGPAGPIYKVETHPPRSRKVLRAGVRRIAAAAPTPSQLQTQAPPAQIVFDALSDNHTFVPPDTMAAVGTDTIIVITNSEIRYVSKTGVTLSGTGQQTHNAFWSGHITGGNAYDPKVYFDQASSRFFVVALSGADSANNRLMIAASKTASPRNSTTDWCKYSFDFGADLGGSETRWFDYPGVGISPRWVIVTGGVANVGAGTVLGTHMVAFSKDDLVNAACPGVQRQNFAFSFNANADAHILMPAINYDATDDIYFAQAGWWALPANTRQLRLYRLTGGPLPTVGNFEDLGLFNVVDSFETIPESPQPGTAETIHTGDDRILSAVIRNNKMWVVHGVGMPESSAGRAAVAWYSFDNITSGARALEQNGIIQDAATPSYYYFPSIGVDQFNNVGIGFSCGHANLSPSACYTGRRSTDALGTMQSVVRYLDGVGAYVKLAPSGTGENRWGDFSATMPDPSDPGILWTIQETVGTAGTNTNTFLTTARWLTTLAKFSMFTAPATAISNFQHTVTGQTTIAVTWSAHADATGYDILEGPAGCDTQTGTRDTVTLNWTACTGNPSCSVTANTTRTICVRPTNPGGTGPLVSITTATFAAAPAVGANSKTATTVTINFTGSAASSGYKLEAHADGAYSAALFSQSTADPNATSLTVSGLTPSTQYFFRLGALNSRGAITYAANIGGITTETNLVPPASAQPSNVTATTIQANWGQGGNPGGVSYAVRASDTPGFASVIGPFTVTAFSRTFTGLTPNTTYYFKVSAVGGPETDLPEVATLALAPANAALSNVTHNSAQLSWTTGANPSPATRYAYEASLSGDFASLLTSGLTTSGSFTFNGLTPNTNHHFRVRALNWASVATSYSSPASGATLTTQPTGAAYLGITYSSVTIQWSHDGNCSYFIGQAALTGGFGNPVIARTDDCSPRSLAIQGLEHDTVYNVRIGAVGLAGEGSANYQVLATTRTPTAVFSTGTVNSAGFTTITLIPPYPQVTKVELSVPPGAIPNGTTVRVDGTAQFLPGANSSNSNAAQVQPLGPATVVDITAGGAQPKTPVPVTFTYSAASILAANRDPKELHVCNFNPEENVWIPLPTRLDATNRTITADLPHFSLFGPFFVSAGACGGDVAIFPVPWEPGSGGEFDAAGITFTGLAAAADVRVFTIKGELVWEGPADVSGILRWDGKNRFGGPAASGVYLAHLGTGNKRCLRRVVIVR